MTEKEVIEYCLSLDGAFERYPFGENPLVFSVPPKKGFCDLYKKSEPTHIVLKCDPMEAIFLRSQYPDSVKPGYHCNKEHWNSVYIDGNIADDEIKRMIFNSYNLVKNKK